MAVDVGVKRILSLPLSASTKRSLRLSTANVRSEKLYCSICEELIHREPFQTYRSNADYSDASHSSEVGCDESRRMARALESWLRVTGRGEEPDIVY